MALSGSAGCVSPWRYAGRLTARGSADCAITGTWALGVLARLGAGARTFVVLAPLAIGQTVRRFYATNWLCRNQRRNNPATREGETEQSPAPSSANRTEGQAHERRAGLSPRISRRRRTIAKRRPTRIVGRRLTFRAADRGESARRNNGTGPTKDIRRKRS